MSKQSSAPTGVPQPPLPSLEYVKQELNRIPRAARFGLNKFGFAADLTQELHLAYYDTIRTQPAPAALKRAIHAAGERLRYREVVRRAKYEVPEELAGRNYHLLMYGEDLNQESTDN